MACHDCNKGWSKSALVWLLLLAAAAAAAVAWTDARTQTFLLPLLVLACPLMCLLWGDTCKSVFVGVQTTIFRRHRFASCFESLVLSVLRGWQVRWWGRVARLRSP
jgi:hypothetical protein